jgi:hypothetical protein
MHIHVVLIMRLAVCGCKTDAMKFTACYTSPLVLLNDSLISAEVETISWINLNVLYVVQQEHAFRNFCFPKFKTDETCTT